MNNEIAALMNNDVAYAAAGRYCYVGGSKPPPYEASNRSSSNAAL